MILDSILGTRSLENPNVPLSQASDELFENFGIARSSSGIRVNPSSAFTYSPIFRAMTLLSFYVAKVPLYIYRVMDDDTTKERAKEHPAYRLGLRKPNPMQTAFVFRQAMQMLALGHGNAYAYIFRRGDGAPREILLLDQGATYPLMKDGNLYYVTTIKNHQRVLMPEDVIHVRGLGDGFLGMSVFDKMRESIGRSLAAQKYAGKFFANGARASGVLMTPGTMRQEDAENLLRNFEKKNSGLDNSHRTILLEEGARYTKISVDPDDAQMLETMRFGIIEVSNWLGIPPHKLGDTSRQGYNSLEQENQSFLDDSIDPWFVNWEQEWGDKLLTEQEKDSDSHRVEFLRQALVRADMAARSAFYGNALRNRWMLPDEVRGRENMNPLPDGLGKKLLDPPNASIKAQPVGKTPPDNGENSRRQQKLRRAYRRMVADAGRRMVSRIGTQAQRLASDPKKFVAWVDEGISKDHRSTMISAFQPAFGKRAERTADGLLGAIKHGLDELVEQRTADELPAAVARFFEGAIATAPSWLRRRDKSDKETRP